MTNTGIPALRLPRFDGFVINNNSRRFGAGDVFWTQLSLQDAVPKGVKARLLPSAIQNRAPPEH